MKTVALAPLDVDSPRTEDEDVVSPTGVKFAFVAMALGLALILVGLVSLAHSTFSF